MEFKLFTIDFFLLAIEGCDAVLGTQWMWMLGPICLDFNEMVMNFKYSSKRIELKKINGPVHKVVEGGVVAKELMQKKTGLLC